MFLEMAIYGVGGLLLPRSNSRSLAVGLFLFSVLNIIKAIESISNGHTNAGLSFTKIIQILVLWGSIRAVEATFKLRGRFADANTQRTK